MSRPRVLFVPSRAASPDAVVQPHGSAVHTASSLGALRRVAEVMVVDGGGDGIGAHPASPALRRMLPQRVRGVRRDALWLRSGRRLADAAVPAAVDFAPDLVYERSDWFSTAGLRLARSLDVPLVLEVNGILAEEMPLLYRSLGEPIGAALERRKARAAAAVVVESPGMAAAVESRLGPVRRVAVVPNTVADERVRAEPRHARNDDLVVAWIGHLMPWHVEALRFLVDAAAAIDGVRFEVIGDGPGLVDLVSRARDRGVVERFVFTGVVPFADVPAMLEHVDLGVVPDMPPHKLPVKLVDLAAAGLPVVAPASASLDAQFEPGVEYLPFDRLDAGSFASVLVGALADPALRDRVGAAALSAVRDRFTWSAAAAHLATLLADVVEERG